MDQGKYNVKPVITFSSGIALLNGMPIASGASVGDGYDYELVVISFGGTHSETIHFSVDTTAPTVTGVVSGVSYEGAKQISFNEGTATLDDVAFSSGTTVTSEGAHKLVVTDSFKNQTVIEFSIYYPRTISFESNGGTIVPPQTVSYNSILSEPVTNRTGYTLLGLVYRS